MPVILVDRLPLPSLKTYTVISVALLSCSIYYAVQVTSEANWKANATATLEGMATSPSSESPETHSFSPQSVDSAAMAQSELSPLLKPKQALSVHIAEVITYMVQEPLCIWVSMVEYNMYMYASHYLLSPILLISKLSIFVIS